MRRIAATLAVVGALLFGAGAAWADRDEGMAAFERPRFAGARCISVTDNWRDCYVTSA